MSYSDSSSSLALTGLFFCLDVFLPYPDGLMVNLKLVKDLIKDLLNQLPKRFEQHHDPYSCLGAALQAAYKLLVSRWLSFSQHQTGH